MLSRSSLVFCCLLLAPALVGASEPGREGEVAIAGGQDALLADMLGRGATFPGQCAFAGAQASNVIRSTYKCPGGDIVFELCHPSKAPATATQTARFGITVLSGSPPPGLASALEARIRSLEGTFQWTKPAPSPVPPTAPSAPVTSPIAAAPAQDSPSVFPVLVAIGLLAVAVLAWSLSRRFVPGDRRLQLVAAIFVVSALARGGLCVINWQANDDHFLVAHLITQGGWQPPASSACMECSHPKLYHYALALAHEVVGSERGTRRAGNLLNFVAGTALLALLYAFSRRAAVSQTVRMLGFAFVSFNAALVGIFSQATNDGFVILFASLAIFYLDRFGAGNTYKHAIAATAFVVLAALSKASGWVIFAAGGFVLCLKLLTADHGGRKQLGVGTAVYILGFLLIVPFINPYRQNIMQAHTPFVSDAFDAPMVKLEVPRPPVAWVFQDFFTFRIFALLRAPFIDWGPPSDPPHRESLWSQLYGRTFFLRFERHIWTPSDPRVNALGRLCLALGLLPLAALLIGTAARVRSVWRGLSTSGLCWFARADEWHHLVYAGVMFSAMIAVVIQYHRTALLFTWMKAIYVLPAILPLFGLFLAGLELLWRRFPRVVTGWMLALIAVSIVDLGWLIHDLVQLGDG